MNISELDTTSVNASYQQEMNSLTSTQTKEKETEDANSNKVATTVEGVVAQNSDGDVYISTVGQKSSSKNFYSEEDASGTAAGTTGSTAAGTTATVGTQGAAAPAGAAPAGGSASESSEDEVTTSIEVDGDGNTWLVTTTTDADGNESEERTLISEAQPSVDGQATDGTTTQTDDKSSKVQ